MGTSASFLINYLLIAVKNERTSLDFSCFTNSSAQRKPLIYSYQEPTGTCTKRSLKPKIRSALLHPHYLGTNPLIPFVPSLLGDKSSHLSREAEVAELKELFSRKPHGPPPNSLCRALGHVIVTGRNRKRNSNVCTEIETACEAEGKRSACLCFGDLFHLARPTCLTRRRPQGS